MTASKPFLRSIAGAAPVVPWSSTMLQLPLLAWASQAPAFEIEVSGNAGDEEGFIRRVDVAVGEENRDAGLLGLAEHLIPTGDDHRRDDDRVDLLGDERANRLELLLFLPLGVGEFEVDSFLLRLFLHVLGKGRAPVALIADL
jgi:hypothetical protein